MGCLEFSVYLVWWCAAFLLPSFYILIAVVVVPRVYLASSLFPGPLPTEFGPFFFFLRLSVGWVLLLVLLSVRWLPDVSVPCHIWILRNPCYVLLCFAGGCYVPECCRCCSVPAARMLGGFPASSLGSQCTIGVRILRVALPTVVACACLWVLGMTCLLGGYLVLRCVVCCSSFIGFLLLPIWFELVVQGQCNYASA